MGHSAFVAELYDAAGYNYPKEIGLLDQLVMANGMRWDLAKQISSSAIDPMLADTVGEMRGFALGDEYRDEDGELLIEGLEIILYNLKKGGHYDMNAEPDFPYKAIGDAENKFRVQLFIYDAAWAWDKSLRLLFKYMQARQDKMPLVQFEGAGYYNYADILMLYNYCEGDKKAIDADIWFGPAWQEMLKSRGVLSASTIKN